MTHFTAANVTFAATTPVLVDINDARVAHVEINLFNNAMFHCRANRLCIDGVLRRGYQFTATDACAEGIAFRLGLDVYRVEGNVFVAVLPLRAAVAA